MKKGCTVHGHLLYSIYCKLHPKFSRELFRIFCMPSYSQKSWHNCIIMANLTVGDFTVTWMNDQLFLIDELIIIIIIITMKHSGTHKMCCNLFKKAVLPLTLSFVSVFALIEFSYKQWLPLLQFCVVSLSYCQHFPKADSTTALNLAFLGYLYLR